MLEAGERIGRYRIEGQLGQGGMGSVYRARDEELGRRVAIKMVAEAQGVPSGSEGHARLLREARAAAALHHPNAVAIFDVGEHDGEPYIVMEYVDGESLREHLAHASPPWRTRARWLVDVARALDAAHREGLVHRDVKPDNIMVRADGTVKVVDFGIARRETTIDPQAPTAPSARADAFPTLTAEGVQVGTVHYMAPEQIRGTAIDGRTDQFAWAVCAYEVLARANPWTSSNTGLGVAAAILTDEPPALDEVVPEIPSGVARLIRKAMRKAPDERFASMGEIADQLSSHLDGRGREPAESSGVMRRYSSEQMRMVLERALAAPELSARYDRSDIVEAAREVGADELELQQALRELDEQQAPKRVVLPGEPGWWNEERQKASYKWLRHLLVFFVINVFLFVTFGAPSWQRWVVLGWGLVLAMQAINVVMPAHKDDKKADKRRRKREAKLMSARELSEATRVLVETTKLRRRVRLDEGALAEAEEALVEEQPARARR